MKADIGQLGERDGEAGGQREVMRAWQLDDSETEQIDRGREPSVCWGGLGAGRGNGEVEVGEDVRDDAESWRRSGEEGGVPGLDQSKGESRKWLEGDGGRGEKEAGVGEMAAVEEAGRQIAESPGCRG